MPPRVLLSGTLLPHSGPREASGWFWNWPTWESGSIQACSQCAGLPALPPFAPSVAMQGGGGCRVKVRPLPALPTAEFRPDWALLLGEDPHLALLLIPSRPDPGAAGQRSASGSFLAWASANSEQSASAQLSVESLSGAQDPGGAGLQRGRGDKLRGFPATYRSGSGASIVQSVAARDGFSTHSADNASHKPVFTRLCAPTQSVKSAGRRRSAQLPRLLLRRSPCKGKAAGNGISRRFPSPEIDQAAISTDPVKDSW